MKNYLRLASFACMTFALALSASRPADAANATWTGNANGNWSVGTNWSTGAAPGATSGTTNTDSAYIFNTTTGVTINVDQTNQNIGSIIYVPGVAANTISGNPLLLSSGGAILNNQLDANIQTINSNLVLEPASSTTNGSYSIINNGGTNMALGGAISGGATSGSVALTIGGTQNSASNIISGVISNGGASGGLSLTKTGGGVWVIDNAETYTGATTVSGGTLNLGNTGNTVTGSLASTTLNLAGGTFNFNALSATASTQTFTTTNLNPGASAVSFTGKVGSALALGTINRAAGSTLTFNTAGITTTNTTNVGGIMGGWAFFNNANWAVAPSVSGGAVTGYAGVFASDTWAPGNNTKVVSSSFSPGANSTTNSLEYSPSATGSTTLTLSGTNIITTGGILMFGTSFVNNLTITGGTLTSGNGTDLIFYNNHNASGATINSVIADNGATSIGFTRGGRAGIPLALGGANTYSGATTLGSGNTQIFASNGLGNGAATNTINMNGGLLQLSINNIDLGTNRTITLVGNTNTITSDLGLTAMLDGVISGSGSLSLNGGTDIISGANTYSGTTSVISGAIQFSAANNLGDGSATNNILLSTGPSATLEFTGAGAVTLGVNRSITAIGASAGQIIADGGTLTINGNLYSSNRGFIIGGAGNITVSGNVMNSAAATFTKIGNGTLIFSGNNTIVAGSSTVLNGGTLELDYSAGSLPSLLSSTGAITENNTGTLLINGATTGTTAVSAGTLTYNGGTTVSTVSNGGTTTLTLAGATRGSNGTIDYIAPASTTITVTGGGTTTVGSIIGSYAFFGSGASEGYAAYSSDVVGLATSTGITASTGLTTGTVNYKYTGAGGTDSAAANLLANTVIFSTTGAQTLALNTRTLTISASGGIMNTNSAGPLSITASGAGSIASSTELILSGSSNITISAPISGTALTDSNTGVVTLSGNNTYTGKTSVNAGILNVQTATGLGTTAGAVAVSAGATLQLQNGSGITIGTSSTKPLSLVGTGAAAATGALENVSGANTYAGLITLGTNSNTTTISSDAGSLSLTNTGATTLGTGTVLSLTGAGNGSFSESLGTGSGGTLAKSGTGTWTLSGANTYTGGTTITGGVLSLTGSSAASTAQATSATSSTTTMTVTSTTGLLIGQAVTGTNITAGSYIASITNGTQFVLSVAPSASVASGTSLAFGGAYGLGAGGTIVASGATLALTGTTTALANTANGITISGAGASGQNGALVSTATLSTDTNTVAGAISLGSSATIASNSGTLALSNTGQITGSGGSAYGLTLKGAGNGSVASAINTGAGSVTKSGAGTWTLTGASTYSGGTTVSQGTLLVNNTTGSATGTGALAVTGTATFGGSGTASTSGFAVTGTSTSSPATIQVGSGGTDTASKLTLTGTAASTFTNVNLTFNLDKTTAGVGNSLIVGTTGITFSGVTLTLNLLNSNPTIANTYTLFDGSGSNQYSGLVTFTNNQGQQQINTVLSGLNFTYVNPVDNATLTGSYLFLTNGGSDIDIEVVPEPGTWAMMLGGLVLLIAIQRRRRLQK